GLKPWRARGEVRSWINHQPGKIWFVERLDPRGQRSVAQNKNGRAILARDAGGFNRDVKTIFNGRCGEHDARTVTVTSEAALMQIALSQVRGHTGVRPAALNVTNEERNLGHRRPADRFALQRNPRTRAAGDGEISGIGETKRERNRAELVFGLHKNSAVFRE